MICCSVELVNKIYTFLQKNVEAWRTNCILQRRSLPYDRHRPSVRYCANGLLLGSSRRSSRLQQEELNWMLFCFKHNCFSWKLTLRLDQWEIRKKYTKFWKRKWFKVLLNQPYYCVLFKTILNWRFNYNYTQQFLTISVNNL